MVVDRLSTWESLSHTVPMRYAIFPEQVAEVDRLALVPRRKIHESAIEILDLHAKFVDLLHGSLHGQVRGLGLILVSRHAIVVRESPTGHHQLAAIGLQIVSGALLRE